MLISPSCQDYDCKIVHRTGLTKTRLILALRVQSQYNTQFTGPQSELKKLNT